MYTVQPSIIHQLNQLTRTLDHLIFFPINSQTRMQFSKMHPIEDEFETNRSKKTDLDTCASQLRPIHICSKTTQNTCL